MTASADQGHPGCPDGPGGGPRPSRPRRVRLVTAAGLVVVALLAIVATSLLLTPARSRHALAALGAATLAPVAAPANTPPVVPAPPIGATGARLVIPAIGVDAPITPETTTGVRGSTLALTIPGNIHQVGWFSGNQTGTGVLPGAPGDALIAGHVDSAAAGEGALFHLDRLTPGATITVVGSNGQATTWRISSPPVVLPKQVVAHMVWPTSGPPTITIVTCGGPFDRASGHYADNVVVNAALVGAVR